MTARIKAAFRISRRYWRRSSAPVRRSSWQPAIAAVQPERARACRRQREDACSTQQLCYSDFAVLHSGVTHGPLWSAEHLTAAHVDDAKNNTRTNRFFAEHKLPPGAGAQLARTTSRAATIAAT